MLRSTRRLVGALAAIAAAILFVLFSSVGTPAVADYNHPCLPAQANVPLDPAGAAGYDTVVMAATNTSPDGQVGVCVRAIGGCGPVGGNCVWVGAGVGGNLVEGDPTMTGVLVQPQYCGWVEYNGTGVDTCFTEGTTGAEANTGGSARVCVEQICNRVN